MKHQGIWVGDTILLLTDFLPGFEAVVLFTPSEEDSMWTVRNTEDKQVYCINPQCAHLFGFKKIEDTADD